MPIKGIKGGVGTKALGYGLGAEQEASDPNFNQTVLLLHSDGSEGEGNTPNLGDPNYKAFRDNSTSAHAIVVQGDAYGNDFSPYYYADGYWSRFSDSTTNSDTHGSGITLGTNNFTIGMFVYPLSSLGSRTALYADTGADTFILAHDQLLINAGSTWTITIDFTTDIVANQWQWLQVDRTGSTFRVSINGSYVDGGGATSSGTIPAINTGTFGERGGQADYTGYFSNFILINGANRGSIATPTAPLTANSDTALLLYQSNRLINNGNTSVTLTSGGDNKISTTTPFTQSKTANVGSGFFDGTTDYLTVAQSADFLFGNNAFSIEFWWYPLDISTTAFYTLEATGGVTFYYSGSAFNLDTRGGSNIITSSNDPILNQWNHIVVTRSGTGANEGAIFLNGTRVAQGTISTNFTTNATLEIGEISTLSGYDLNGYLSDYRVVNGSNVYNPASSSITVPTTSLTAVTNTKLLTCQYSGAVRNVGFVDDSKYNHRIVRVGDSYHGTFSPFSLEDGYWSVYGDSANTDYVQYPIASLQALGSGVYTIEFWAYLTIPTSSSDWRPFFGASNGSGSNPKFNLHDGGSSVLSLEDNGGTLFSTGSVRDQYTNQWCHIAVVREGTGTNQTHIYVNGSKEGTGTHDKDLSGITNDTAGFRIGRNPEDHQQSLDGYISNFKMTAAVLYTGSSFTVPTSPLTLTSQGSSSSNVKLLTHQSNRFLDNSSTGYAPTPVNAPKVQPFSPFTPTRSYSKDAIGGSVYFDNTGDYIFADGGSTAGSSFRVPTGEQFSTEFWLYKTGATNNVDIPISAEVLDEFQFTIDANAKLSLNFFGSTITSSPTFPLASNPPYHHCWNHFVVTRDSSDNKIRTFINGNLVSITGAITTDITFQDLVIGHQGKGTDHGVQGFMASVRHNVGDIPSAYTTTETSTGTQVFTAPTAPVTADNNTVLLLNFNNAGIIDHTMKNNLNTVGNVRIRTDVKKLGTGSIYFDGSDSIRWRQTSDISTGMAIGTGPFTIEFFVYFDGDPNNGGTNGQASLIRDAGGGLVIQRYDGEWEAGNESTPQIQVAQSLSNQTWYHVAMTRDSSANLKLFINGTQAGSTATSHTTDFSKNEWHLGALNADGSGGRALTGYMDEIRIIVGVALYTSNFTAPTEPFANR